jgi:hypothetical protein
MADLKTALLEAGSARPAYPPPRQAPLRLPMKPRPGGIAEHVRELTMCDGRRVMCDRRSISFICEGNAGADGTPATIVAWRTFAKPVPVREAYADVVAWWLGDDR